MRVNMRRRWGGRLNQVDRAAVGLSCNAKRRVDGDGGHITVDYRI